MGSLFGNRLKYVRARAWRNDASFVYPEKDLESLPSKSDLGVTFSGGGTRSAAAVAGQLRGLKQIGLLKQIKYISSVSGGAWGATPYTFLPDSFDEDEFLGEILSPADIIIDSLNATSKKSLVGAIADSIITDDFFAEAAKSDGDETYSRAIGNIFLDPFDLGDNGQFMSFDEATVATALEQNSKDEDHDYYLKRTDFYVARRDRPFLIAGSTLFSGQQRWPKIPREFTPYYSGTRNYFDFNDPIGGGYLETFGADSERPKRSAKTVKVKLGAKRHRFALSDMIGASGAAPQELLGKHNIGIVGFPEFRHWAFKQPRGFADDEELSYGDGGHLENLGIMPLLARQVKNIIVFVNSKTKFIYDADPDICEIASSLPNLLKPSAGDGFRLKVVIKNDNRNTKYKELLNAFRLASDTGKTLIHSGIYDIRSNKYYSVSAYSDVRITWIYNQNVTQWFDALPYHTKRMIEDGEVKRFPHYRTFFQNPPKVIDLSRTEAGLLAHLSCWNVIKNKGQLMPQ